MKASLILCVKNGGEQLRACLEHLALINAASNRFEIILVDNGSTDGISYEMMAEFAAHSSVKCQLLQSFTPGNSAGRNSGIEKATGELLIFIDADCYVEPSFISDWLDVFEHHDIDYASGRIMRFNHQFSMLGCNESLAEELIPSKSFVRRGLIQGSNMAFTRMCFDRAGLFDDKFGAGTSYAGEEWELALRCSFAGLKGGYFPKPCVAHDHQRSDHTAYQRLLFYDYGAGAVYAKHFFSFIGPVILRKILGEIRRSRDLQQSKQLLKGFIDYYIK